MAFMIKTIQYMLDVIRHSFHQQAPTIHPFGTRMMVQYSGFPYVKNFDWNMTNYANKCIMCKRRHIQNGSW